jgi:hypothetical protein
MNTKNAKQFFVSCAVAASLSGFIGPVFAGEAPQTHPGTKISFSPLPLEIYMQDGQRPAVVFSTPCIQIEKMTNGFPPILAFENFMLAMIGKVNESELLPISLEPVCI